MLCPQKKKNTVKWMRPKSRACIPSSKYKQEYGPASREGDAIQRMSYWTQSHWSIQSNTHTIIAHNESDATDALPGAVNHCASCEMLLCTQFWWRTRNACPESAHSRRRRTTYWIWRLQSSYLPSHQFRVTEVTVLKNVPTTFMIDRAT